MKVLTKEYLGYTFLSSGEVFKNGKEVRCATKVILENNLNIL